MKHPSLSGYLCLSDMLDQDLSAYEDFQGLPPEVRQALKREDNITESGVKPLPLGMGI